jgi:hypothetical protein
VEPYYNPKKLTDQEVQIYISIKLNSRLKYLFQVAGHQMQWLYSHNSVARFSFVKWTAT